MKDFLRHFKLSLIVTPIILLITTVVGIALVTQFKGANLKRRSEMLGQGMAIASMVLIAPFWIYGAIQLGKERRAALDSAKKLRKKQNGRR
jgi:hypothetical protein